MAIQKRPSKEVWAKAREVWEADPRPGYAWLVEQEGLGVSIQAVQKRAVSEAWAKNETLEGMRVKAHRKADKKLMARKKVDEKVDASTSEIELAIDRRAEIIDQHRGDWDEIRAAFPVSALQDDIDKAKTAKIVAEVYATIQANERKAWALDEQPPEQAKGGATDAEVNATIVAIYSKSEVAHMQRQAELADLAGIAHAAD